MNKKEYIITELLPFEVEDANSYHFYLRESKYIVDFLHLLMISPLEYIRETVDDYIDNGVPIDYLIDIVDLSHKQAIKYVDRNAEDFLILPNNLKNSYKFIEDAVVYNPDVLRYIDEKYLSFNLYHKAVYYNPSAIKYVPKREITEELFISSLTNYEHSSKHNHWNYCPFEIESNYDAIINVLKIQPYLYLDFDESLKNSKGIVQELLMIDGNLVSHVPKKLQTENNLLNAAQTIESPKIIFDIMPSLFSKEETMISLIKTSLSFLPYMDYNLKSNINVANVVFDHNRSTPSIEFFDKKIKSDREIALKAVHCNWKNLEHIDKKFLKDESFIHDLVKKYPFGKHHLDFFDLSSINSPEIISDIIIKSKPCLEILQEKIVSHPKRDEIVLKLLSSDNYQDYNFNKYLDLVSKLDIKKSDSHILLSSLKSFFNVKNFSEIKAVSEVNQTNRYIADKEFSDFLDIHPLYNYLLSLDLELTIGNASEPKTKKIKL